MAFRTIKAKFACKCRRCGESILVGQRMRYGGRGLTYHLSAECGGKPVDQLEEFDKSHGDEGSGGFRTCSQGGRCEDFPCCGCYGLHGRELSMPQEPSDPYDDEYDGRW